MSAQEYGCNYCKITFKKPETDNSKGEDDIQCPRCGSRDTEKFDSLADKLRFFGSFAFSGG